MRDRPSPSRGAPVPKHPASLDASPPTPAPSPRDRWLAPQYDMTRSSRFARYTVLLGAALIAACQREQARTGGVDTGLALATSARQKDSLIVLKDSLLADRQRQLSEQSALIGDAATSARLITEINTSLAKVRDLKVKGDTARPESGVASASTELAAMKEKVSAVLTRLDAAEARVRSLRKERSAHADWDSTQVAQLRTYERSIADLRASVEEQQSQISSLTGRVDSLSRANVALSSRNDSVVALNRAMAAHEDSVFVAIGTEDQLKRDGIVRREGGTWILLGRGKTLVPGRDLDRGAFRVLSKEKDRTISLPVADKDYLIVSRHNLAYTDAPAAAKMRVRGALHITDPERFWGASRFLILVQR